MSASSSFCFLLMPTTPRKDIAISPSRLFVDRLESPVFGRADKGTSFSEISISSSSSSSNTASGTSSSTMLTTLPAESKVIWAYHHRRRHHYHRHPVCWEFRWCWCCDCQNGWCFRWCSCYLIHSDSGLCSLIHFGSGSC